MKEIVLLGSTGSIGVQTLDVCRAHNIKVKALSANSSVELMEQQAREFKPQYVCLADESSATELKTRLADTDIKVLGGFEGVCELARLSCDIVVNSVVGMVGLRPTLEAAAAGNDIALANKETLVAGGTLVTECVKKHGVKLLPIDSEHSAI
ncbi:MAG: 1-deoxy-D-xylulose-5-phosphate reductoisomerase, partial [Oscillospiraceae bacterium]|nr:1-deoxy-D-xylulose-5-phosphate reductoisomerase [Oscillospiraceae bacterium]